MPEPQPFISGALLDTRTEGEKLSDVGFVELVAAANPVSWTTKKKPTGLKFDLNAKTWRRFPIFDQDGSGSCVAQTMRKMLGVLYYLLFKKWIDFSAAHIYLRRINKPNAGMGATDVFKIAGEGVTLNALAPSDGMSDAQMDATVIDVPAAEVAKVFAIDKFIFLPTGNLEAIASVIQTTLKAVMVWTFWQYQEWTAVPKVLFPSLTAGAAEGRHSITAVDYTLYEGEKALVIDDSWGAATAMEGQRVLKDSFFKARNYFAGYVMSFKFEKKPVDLPPSVPHYTFTKPLEFIPLNAKKEVSDLVKNAAQLQDVIALQNYLREEGHFPANVSSSGYYGKITADAVFAWQKEHNVAPLPELETSLVINGTPVPGGRFGQKSIDKYNALHS